MNENQNPSSKRKKTMLTKDKIILSPIDKYRLYGRFPYKMISHIFLIISTSVQVMLINSIKANYCRGQERVYYTHFISDADKENPDYAREKYLYSVEQIKEHISKSITNYYDISESSFEMIEYPLEASVIEMKVTYKDQQNKVSDIPNNDSFNLTKTTFGPFDYEQHEVKKYLNNVRKLKINYIIYSFVTLYYEECLECFGWSVNQIYDYDQGSHILVKLEIERFSCDDKTELSQFSVMIMNFIWIHWIVIVLALTSFCLTWKSIYNIYKASVSLIMKKNDTYRSYSINKWNCISLVGNILQIIGAILGSIDLENMNASTDILIGFGCMISYFSIGKYLNYDIEYSTIYATLQRSLPNSIRFLIGMTPIFIGFVFSGLCLFWQSEFFMSGSGASITLFSMLNGDSIYDVISDLARIDFFLGQLYSYVFCMLFIVVVMNVFISIIAEAYVSSKMRNRNHWIYNYLKVDPQFAQISGFEQENVVQLPEIENMEMIEIKEELNKRIIRFNKNIIRCRGLSKDLSKIDNKITQEQLKAYLNTQFNTIENKIKKLSDIWESGALKQ